MLMFGLHSTIVLRGSKCKSFYTNANINLMVLWDANVFIYITCCSRHFIRPTFYSSECGAKSIALRFFETHVIYQASDGLSFKIYG